jgi:quercetin dioxygenase-like cupin family protein
MQNKEKFTNIVVEHESEALEVFGPRLHFLVRPEANDEAPCVVKGTVPAGVSVPMHSHSGIEAFYVLDGEIEVLREKSGDFDWIRASPGDFIEVPSGARHGFRNRSQLPVVLLITTTSKLGRFFQEVAKPINQGANFNAPLPEEIQHFAKTAERYGYWLATPEENALVGISLFQSK